VWQRFSLVAIVFVLACHGDQSNSTFDFLPWHERFCWAAQQPDAQSFDRDSWRSSDESGRGRMVSDLICSGTLLDKNEQEIIQLLGKPDDRRGQQLVYRVYRRNGFLKYPTPQAADDSCETGHWELTFEFSADVPTEATYSFSFEDRCWTTTVGGADDS